MFIKLLNYSTAFYAFFIGRLILRIVSEFIVFLSFGACCFNWLSFMRDRANRLNEETIGKLLIF